MKTCAVKTTTKSTLMVFILSMALACSSAPRPNVYLKKSELSELDKVALDVSSSELFVKYSTETGASVGAYAAGIIAPLFLFFALAGESSAESYEDHESAERVREALGEYQFEKLLGDYFLRHLSETNLFKINYSGQKSHKALVEEGYDAIIELNIEELSLRRGTYNLKVLAKVCGEMVDLQQEEVIWCRVEVVMSNEEYSLDEYKEEGGKLLKDLSDKILRKIAFRLASDIIYSK